MSASVTIDSGNGMVYGMVISDMSVCDLINQLIVTVVVIRLYIAAAKNNKERR